MFMQRLLGREPAQSVDGNDSAQANDDASDLFTTRRSLKRRDRRIAFLRRKLHSERREHARELDCKDSEIMKLRKLIAERTDTASASDSDVMTLKKELAMVTALLDEFEDDASRARRAEARVVETEAECLAKDAVIAALQRDNKAWQCTTSAAAINSADDYPESIEHLVANKTISKNLPETVIG